jgi:hypothetical protein
VVYVFLYVRYCLVGLIPQKTINTIDAFEQTQLFHPNNSYISPGFKFLYNVKNSWWITATAKGWIVAQNIGAAPGFDIGVAYKIEK